MNEAGDLALRAAIAQLNVESNGEAVLRLRDAKGTIRVKIGASEEGSGLILVDAKVRLSQSGG